MPVSPLLALSPLDGRYAAKVESLRPLLSEYGLIRRRLQVEVEWFIALSEARFTELRPFGPESVAFLRGLVEAFSEADAEEIKAIERTEQPIAVVRGRVQPDQPRRQGGRVLARRAHRRRDRAGTGNRLSALRLHQRGHQQHQPCADARRGAARCAAAGARRRAGDAARQGRRARGPADALAHARPDGDADDAGQGDRQRRGPPGAGARADRSGAAARQDERRRTKRPRDQEWRGSADRAR